MKWQIFSLSGRFREALSVENKLQTCAIFVLGKRLRDGAILSMSSLTIFAIWAKISQGGFGCFFGFEAVGRCGWSWLESSVTRNLCGIALWTFCEMGWVFIGGMVCMYSS